MTMRGIGWLVPAAWIIAVGGLVPNPLEGQTFQGRVLDDASDEPVSSALVRLLSREGDPLALAIADSSGVYRVQAPVPGIYRLEATRLGFETFESPLLDAAVSDATYPVDLLMRAAPVPLEGFTVDVDRVSEEQADRQVQLIIGLSPRSLRYRPIGRDRIQAHIEAGRDLTLAVRSSNLPGLVVRRTTDGPCFSLRARGCLPIFLNGLRLRRDFTVDVPLDMIFRIVFVTPTDGSMVYPSGAVLLYTEGWLR